LAECTDDGNESKNAVKFTFKDLKEAEHKIEIGIDEDYVYLTVTQDELEESTLCANASDFIFDLDAALVARLIIIVGKRRNNELITRSDTIFVGRLLRSFVKSLNILLTKDNYQYYSNIFIAGIEGVTRIFNEKNVIPNPGHKL
jgi:hypothetical protein